MACAMPPSRTHIFYTYRSSYDPGVIPLLAFGVLFTLLRELKATAANLPAGTTSSGYPRGPRADNVVIPFSSGANRRAHPPPLGQ